MLARDPELRKFVEMYAQDQNMFFDHYSQAHVKMSEFGQEENLLSEFEENKPRKQGLTNENGVILGTHQDPQ